MASLSTEEIEAMEQVQPVRSLSTGEIERMEATSTVNPREKIDEAGLIWDLAVDSNISLVEAERIYNINAPEDIPVSDGLTKRLGKQLYNNTVANTLHTLGKSDSYAARDTAFMLLQKRQKELGVTLPDDLFQEQWNDWTKQLTEPPETRESDYLKSERQYSKPQSEINPFAAEVTAPEAIGEKLIDTVAGITGFVTQIALLKKVAPSMPEGAVWETVSLANGGQPGSGAAMQATLAGIGQMIPSAGILPAVGRGTATSILFGTSSYLGGGDTVDILINMGVPFAFEGMGITKQQWAKYKNKRAVIDTLKQKAPELQGRSSLEIEKGISDLLSNVTEIAARDILRPPQGEPVTPELLARDRISLFQSEKNVRLTAEQNAAALEFLNSQIGNRPSLLPGLPAGFAEFVAKQDRQQRRSREQMEKEFAPKEREVDISTELKNYLQRKRYDELLERATAGDKRAIKELNDYIQGTNIPTYEELLERGFAGDQSAFERIQTGDYRGGPQAEPQLRIPAAQRRANTARIEQQRPLTPLENVRAAVDIIESSRGPRPKLPATELAKARERGFITSIKEVLPELRIEGEYIPRSTDVLAIKARNLIVDDIVAAERIAVKGRSDASVAITSELIKYYGEQAAQARTPDIKDAWYEKAAALGVEKAHQLTEAGRFTQAASILGRYTPEGQIRFAAREIQRYNEDVVAKRGGIGGLKKKIPELTGKQAEYILKEMQEISQMPNGKAKVIRFNALQEHITGLVPTPLYKKVISVWKAGLLTGWRTHGLNFFANLFHTGSEVVKDLPASVVDKMAGYFTGKRTKTPTIRGIREGGLEGFKKGLEYIRTGYSERDIGAKLDYTRVNFGSGNLAKGLQAYTQAVFRLMGAGDQPFYYATKLRSMYEQAKVSAINLGLKGKAAQAHIDRLMNNPTEQMIKNASMDAEAAVFINNTKLGDMARGFQRWPGGEIIVPFGRTPSAVAMQIVNYSPVGIAKTIIENIGKGRFDQRAFSQGIGRGITGTAVLAIGAALYDKGLITLDRPQTEKERKLWELEGRQANTVNAHGKWRTVQAFGPIGNLLIIGGHFKRAFDEEGSPTAAMTRATFGTAKSFIEQTFLMGLKNVTDGISDPERSASFVAGNLISSIVPTISGDIAKATDVKERRAETITEKVLAKIPGARQTLEPKVTVLGEERKPTANPVELMLDPTRPSKAISSPVIDELRRLWDEGWEVSPNQLGTRKGYTILTQAENTELWKRAGSVTNAALEQLVTSDEYTTLPDENKADAISTIITAAQKVARTEMVIKKLSGLEGDELATMLFELRKSGLATQDIIPIALSKRNPKKARAQSRKE